MIGLLGVVHDVWEGDCQFCPAGLTKIRALNGSLVRYLHFTYLPLLIEDRDTGFEGIVELFRCTRWFICKFVSKITYHYLVTLNFLIIFTISIYF